MFAEIISECRDLAAEARDEVKKVHEAPERERSSMSASIFGLLKKADENLESLQRHAKHAGAAERTALAKEEEVLRTELRAVARELEEAKRNLLLTGGGSTEKLFLAREERRRATAITATLEKSTARLQEANRTAAQSETIAVGTLQELRKQREQLHGINDKVGDFGQNMKAANKHLEELEKPACILM